MLPSSKVTVLESGCMSHECEVGYHCVQDADVDVEVIIPGKKSPPSNTGINSFYYYDISSSSSAYNMFFGNV